MGRAGPAGSMGGRQPMAHLVGIILTTLFSFTLSLVTQMLVGHLSELELAGASVTNIGIQGLAYGIMVCNCVFFLHFPVLCIC